MFSTHKKRPLDAMEHDQSFENDFSLTGIQKINNLENKEHNILNLRKVNWHII